MYHNQKHIKKWTHSANLQKKIYKTSRKIDTSLLYWKWLVVDKNNKTPRKKNCSNSTRKHGNTIDGKYSWWHALWTWRAIQNKGKSDSILLVEGYEPRHQWVLRKMWQCQKTKKFKHETKNVVILLALCSEPNQRVHKDLFGPLKTTESGKNTSCVSQMHFQNLLNL